MNNELNQHFLAFVRAQDRERPISHRSWEACAVGDFAREHYAKTIDVDDLPPAFIKNCLGIKNYDEYYQKETLGYFLNKGEKLGNLTTYGELQDLLDTLNL